MTETGIPPISENDEASPGPSSTRTMLITMLLLIAGLMLSSVLMLDYVMDRRSGTEGGTAFDFSILLPKRSSVFGRNAAVTASDTAENADAARPAPLSDSAVSRLFSGHDDGSVKWPRLKLTGFGRSVDRDGSFAIINGEQVLVGNYIGEVMLVEIRAQGAVVEYRGERRFITVDQAR